MLEKFIQDALIIWATISGPLSTQCPILTAHLSPSDRRRAAYKTVIYAEAALTGSAVIG